MLKGDTSWCRFGRFIDWRENLGHNRQVFTVYSKIASQITDACAFSLNHFSFPHFTFHISILFISAFIHSYINPHLSSFHSPHSTFALPHILKLLHPISVSPSNLLRYSQSYSNGYSHYTHHTHSLSTHTRTVTATSSPYIVYSTLPISIYPSTIPVHFYI